MSINKRKDHSETSVASQEINQKDLVVSWGVRTTLQITHTSERIVGRVIGVSPGEVIMVRVTSGPIFHEIRDFWPKLIMRFAAEGSVYGFQSPILGTLERPAVIFVKWPQQVEAVKLRVHERVPCLITVGLLCGDARYDAMITDLSAGGCRLAFSKDAQIEYPQLHADQQVKIELIGEAGHHTLTARIKNVVKEDSPKYGLMFEQLSQDQQLAIDQLMNDLKAIW